MVRIIRHFPANRPNGTDRKPLFDEEKPLYPVVGEDTFDNLLAGLTHRPDVASSDVAQLEVAANEPTPTKLPSVEEFHFDEAAAKNMASKLAPNQKPRIKSRRPRYRSPNRDRWRMPGERIPDERDEQFDERNADDWNSPKAIAVPRGNGRGLFWTFCASILVVIGTSAAFGFVQPLNDLLPARMGDFLGGLSENLSAGLVDRTDTSADFKVAGDTANSGPQPASSEQPMTTAAVARAVPTTTVLAEVRPSANNGGSGLAELDEPPGATSEKAFELGATVLELGNVDGAEFATSKSAAAIAAAPARPEAAAAPAATTPAATAPAAAAPAQGNENAPRKPVSQQFAKADPLQLTNTTPAITPEPMPSAAPPVISSLSAAQIDRLLARGKELLQRGDIASARLLFLRVDAAGDRRGARGVGMTYDPRVYARLPVTGLTPDREQAEIWYKKAGENSALTIDFGIAAETRNAADTRKAQEARAAERNAACARKYNSFEPSTGLYTTHGGSKRPCKLP